MVNNNFIRIGIFLQHAGSRRNKHASHMGTLFYVIPRMEHYSQIRQMAAFALNTQYTSLPESTLDQLKRHLLDSLGSFIHALHRPTVQKLVRAIRSLSTAGPCEAPILGPASIDRAAQLYTALIRYPDFMDNFLGKEATCHPSDNIGALLALSQAGYGDSTDFLIALAVSYEIECRLVEELPVMIKGFDHTVLLAFSLTAGICRMLRLDETQTAHALAMAGVSLVPLVTSRASYTSEWKGLASSFVALNCIQLGLMAKEGITGPLTLFEGPKGYKDIFGMTLQYDWDIEDFSLIQKCALKTYNAEIHTQPALEAIQDILRQHPIHPDDIQNIDITTFLTCYHIVGGGEYGPRDMVHSKEQADHSLPYVAAVLLLDGQVYPSQLLEERILRPDVQSLLKKVKVHTRSPLHTPVILAGLLDPYTQAYPEKLSCKVTLTMSDGKEWTAEKEDYHGYYTRPLGWEEVEDKFRRLTTSSIDGATQTEIIHLCRHLENSTPGNLMKLTLCNKI